MNPMNQSRRIGTTSLALATAIALGGCASSLSGVGSTESFACKAPVGAQCTSISGVYANANPLGTRSALETPAPPQSLLAKTPGSTPAPKTQGPAPLEAAPARTSTTMANTTAAPTPTALRSPPRVIRLWIAPWEDADGDLHEASFLHVVVDTGRWLIKRVRPAARSRLDIATPPVTPHITSPGAPPGLPPGASTPTSDARSAADLAPTEP